MSESITIEVNSEETILNTSLFLSGYIKRMGISGRFIIVVNGEIISKSDYSSYLLKDGDRLDIISPITGG